MLRGFRRSDISRLQKNLTQGVSSVVANAVAIVDFPAPGAPTIHRIFFSDSSFFSQPLASSRILMRVPLRQLSPNNCCLTGQRRFSRSASVVFDAGTICVQQMSLSDKVSHVPISRTSKATSSNTGSYNPAFNRRNTSQKVSHIPILSTPIAVCTFMASKNSSRFVMRSFE